MKPLWPYVLGLVSVILLLVGSWIGLFGAPPERWMGDVMRIMYIHVPTAWASLACFTAAFVCAVGYLSTSRWGWDDALEACVEIGVLMGALLLFQGSAWARPTWGVWWTWDPRLTSMAVLELSFVGVLALRGFVDEPDKRAQWASVASIFASAGVPLTYFAVKWRGIHQTWSTKDTVDSYMRQPLYINAVAVLLLAVALVGLRRELARRRRERLLQEVP